MTLVERLTGMTVDWDGTQMSDAEEPRAIPSCGDLRAAADEITRLTNELEQIKATYENLEASEILNGYRTRADRLTAENEKLTAYHAFARQNFHTMQNAANELRIRAERAEAENERLRGENARLQKRLTPQWWYDCEDPENYGDFYKAVDNAPHGEPFEVAGAATVKIVWFASLPPAPNADSDDDWECEADTKEDCLRMIAAENERRAALEQP